MNPTIDLRKASFLFLILFLCWLPVIFDRSAIQSAAKLFPLAESADPYFFWSHPAFLYFWTPLVALSSFVVVLTPGFFIALSMDAAEEIGDWVVNALGISIVTISISVAVAMWIAGDSLRGSKFVWIVVLLSMFSFGLLLFRVRQGKNLRWPLKERIGMHAILSALLIPSLILVFLIPKFYWENFNGDGVHAFESIRLLLKQPLPFWPNDSGAIRGFPGITSMLFAYPGSWFVRLFGENEAAARLPYLLYLVTLYFAILAVVKRRRDIKAVEYWLIWVGLIVYTVVVSFSATYSPYAADIALPATQDTLLMVCFLGFISGFLKNSRGLIVLFTLLTFLSLPNGPLLIAFWVVAVLILWRPVPTNSVISTVLALVFCLVLSLTLPYLLQWFGHPVPGKEYEGGSLLKRLIALEWKEWKRILFVLVPCGIAPFVAMLYWRSQNIVSKTLCLVTASYFVFFYFQRHAVLHHFIPAMILPIPAFWQNKFLLESSRRNIFLVCVFIFGSIAFVLSLPVDATPDTRARTVGWTIEDRLGGYTTLASEGFRTSAILHKLFPPSWDRSVPDRNYGGSAIVWYHYANRKSGDQHPEINYVIQRSSDKPLEGMQLISTTENVSLYLRSKAILENHRSMKPSAPIGSSIYRMERQRLFRSRRQ